VGKSFNSGCSYFLSLDCGASSQQDYSFFLLKRIPVLDYVLGLEMKREVVSVLDRREMERGP